MPSWWWCVVSASFSVSRNLPFSFLCLFLLTGCPCGIEFVRICRRRDRQTAHSSQKIFPNSSESFFMFLTDPALPSICFEEPSFRLQTLFYTSHYYLIAGSEENKRENIAPNVTEKTSLVNKGEDDESMKKLKAYQP